jgi:hypothetical protein
MGCSERVVMVVGTGATISAICYGIRILEKTAVQGKKESKSTC